MGDYSSNRIHNSLPRQKLSLAKKTKSWGEDCVEAVVGMGYSNTKDGRTTWQKKQANYNMVNSIIDEADFTNVLNPYGLDKEAVGGSPAKLRSINLAINKINVLKGEEMHRPFNWQVMAINGGAVSFKESEKKKMLLENAQKMIAKEAGIPQLEMINPETGEPEEPETFEQVEKFASHSITDIREEWANHILKYLENEQKLALTFNEGWEHALITAEEIYYVGIVNGEPTVRKCNPLNVDFDRNPDDPQIEHGDWFKEDRWMTVGQILDEFGEHLTDDQVRRLDEGDLKQGMSNKMHPGFAYSMSDIHQYENGQYGARANNNSKHQLVSHVVWKSMKKIGFASYEDENGETQTSFVNDDFKITPEMKEMGYEVDWRWIPEVWEGTKIGDSFYVNIGPMPNQSRSMDNPSKVDLPYVGRIYNSTNSEQTSIIDLIKPHQHLYNIVWFRLETELAKAKGKKMVMDIAQIPRSEGIDLDKWMYMFDNMGIAFINSFEEGKEKFQGQVSQFNQFQSIDMGLSQAVGQYVQILNLIEQTVDRIVGVTPQREGQTNSGETATSTRVAITNSSFITEPWFYIHNEVKKCVLTAMLEAAKFAFPDKKKLNYIVDDVHRSMIEIDMEKFSDSDYGLFVTNSAKDNMIFNKLEQLATMAIQSDKAAFSDIIAIYKAESVSEIAKRIEKGEANKIQRDQQAQEQQSQMQQQQIQANQEEQQAAREFEAQQNQLDRESKLQVASISSMGFDADVSGEADGQINVIEQSKLALEQSKVSSDTANKRLEISANLSDKQKDRQLKEKEIKSKEKIEALKARTALKNKVSGEK